MAYLSEAFMFSKLRAFYPANEFALLPQVGNATGFHTNRHIDAVALSLWPSRGIHLHGIEIKCDYRDWRREREEPEKAEAIAKYCNYFWIAVSNPKVCPLEELPENWGLYVWNADKEILEQKKPAAFRAQAVEPTWPFVAAMLRKAQECVGPVPELQKARLQGVEEGKAEAARTRDWEMKALQELREKVAKFEKASGIDISYGWQGADKVGEAVRLVLNGDVMRQREHLVMVAKGILRDLNIPEDPPETKERKRKR